MSFSLRPYQKDTGCLFDNEVRLVDNKANMPHLRTRFIETLVKKTLNFSPIVGILGHRQVGKTTLLQQITQNYETFDDEDTLRLANESPKKFLKGLQLPQTAIDECQLVPGLFPALKERIRLTKKPGQFLLSGSVRFTGREVIRESLTGRIISLELLPFSLSELIHADLPDTAIRIMSETNLDNLQEALDRPAKTSKKLSSEIPKYFKQGGLPGVCFIRDEQLRALRIREQLNTLLDRDLRLIQKTTLPVSQILDFLTELASLEGTPIRHSQLKRKVKISEITQKKLLYALEAIFLIRRLPIEGSRKGFTVYFEDQAEKAYLSQVSQSRRDFEGVLYRNLRTQWFYRLGDTFRFFSFLTRGGARVPFCVQTATGTLGVITLEAEVPNQSDLASAGSFLKYYSNSKVVFVSPFQFKTKILSSRTLLMPLTALV